MAEVRVRVAVRIRPLLAREVLHRHQVCVRVVPGSAQVLFGSDRLFSFDHAFGPSSDQDEVYEVSVRPLVQYLVHGCNATVFCYGQTGSGKTYTLGGGNQDEEGGIIDRVGQDVFVLLAERSKNNDGVEAKVRVSYIELYKEELRDLLELNTNPKELHIRDDERGNTVVVGAKEIVVTSGEELLSLIEMGNALRHTNATEMNEHSSRSHTILTLQVNICCQSNDSLKPAQSSKLCLVDLAGSEHARKTGNTGTRLKESAHINTGLLALGKVIRALSDPARIRRGKNLGSTHIPYRDAKITRLLRDSLGGAAHTLMVACVSPSHHFDAETLNVLQFASKACHIRNCPGAINPHTEVKGFPTTWHPNEARIRELEYEAETLRELLKDKEKDTEMEMEKTGARVGEESRLKQSSEIQISKPAKKVNQGEMWQYCLLAKEAAGLLSDISGLLPNLLFRQQVKDWHERLTAVCLSSETDKTDFAEGQRDRPPHANISKFSKVHKCQKDAELKRLQDEVKKLLQERSIHLKDFEEAKERSRIQAEQLVDQQILIDRLRSKLLTFHGANSGPSVDVEASGFKGKRPHSVPLTGYSCVRRPARKIHSSPPAYSLERVMAAFKMRGRLLLAEIEEKDCPFIKQQAECKDTSQEEEEEEENESFNERKGFRRSLNRTWTSQRKKSTGLDHTLVGNPEGQLTQWTTDAKGNQLKKSHMNKARRAAERKIHDLSVNMQMKEELIKELDRTETETQALDRGSKRSGNGREVDVLARLSVQSQQVRAEAYRSLQHMRLQRAQLLSSLDQPRNTGDDNIEHGQNVEQSSEGSIGCKEEKSNRMLRDTSWMEEEEEQVLQKRAELQELEEELKRREDVLLRREACLQQKNKLENKMLRSSQALNQDLLRVSTQLKSVEEQLQSSSSSSSSNLSQTRSITIEELDKERGMLKKRRDTLDAQLRDNRVLTVEEEHSLLQLEEAIEALDAALEFKNHSIKNKQQQLSVNNSLLHQSQSTEPAQLCDVTRKLKDLSPPEAFKLLLKYFNKVVCLREAERLLRLRCEELELHAGEQEAVLRKMEAAMQSLALDTDRRLTQQHKDHQNNIQLLLQKLKEGNSGAAEQAIQDRLQHLEKELFFYKTSTRQLKKKIKELLSDAMHPDNEPSCKQKNRQMHNTQTQANANKPQTHSKDVQMGTQMTTTYTKIYAERDTKTNRDFSPSRQTHQMQYPPSASQALKKTTLSEHNQILTHFQGKSVKGQSEESSEVYMCHRELRKIPPADLHVSVSATWGQRTVVDISTESVLEDSIEVLRKTDG
ncbi:kinesin-like protein KIF27 [Cololabis saira]|uniref:kinesin-like protein KIF27 n=1 Tax=Cololabis saira TaxID=129043 RepID=UPI002AD259B3|nr:kinesin-like protein KIF27 [Cololabis saira]